MDASSTPQPPALKTERFAERGIAVPFTTSLLAGARARPAKAGAVEIVVPNPAGGKGSYVIDLKLVVDFCQLTVHDQLLVEGLLGVDVVTPATVRRVAREVAKAGAAGREAARSAADAAEREDAAIHLAHYLLMVKLLAQAGLEDIDWRRLDTRDRALRNRLRERLGTLAPALGMSIDELFGALEDLAVVAAPIGFASGEFASRHEATLDETSRFARSIRGWAAIELGEARETAERVADAAEWTVGYARPLLIGCRALLEDIRKLLLVWRSADGVLRDRFTACEWLLDGWQEVCALWRTVARDGRPTQRVTLAQIERLLAVSPDDLQQRGPVASTLDDKRLHRSRWVKLYEDWRTGIIVHDATARREEMRAVTA